LRERKERVQLLSRALGDPARALQPLMQRLDERSDRLQAALAAFRRQMRARLDQARLRHPRDLVRLAAQRLQNAAHRMQALGRERILQTEKKLERLDAMLQALSPRAVLGRGYGLVYDAGGKLVTKSAALKQGGKIRIELYDGSRGAVIED
jgi:exodeoxyribonuclease VII large subunit